MSGSSETITVMGVQGHYHTMKRKFHRDKYVEWWDKLYQHITTYNVKLLVGDFNESLAQVVPRLRERGLLVDCCSWYPFLHDTLHDQGIRLGMDSCAMFHIGGDVRISMPWGYSRIDRLLVAAACDASSPQSRQDGLDT